MENIRQAVAADHTQRRLVGQIDTIREKLGSLTRREHAVLMEVVSGGTNKIIATSSTSVSAPSRYIACD